MGLIDMKSYDEKIVKYLAVKFFVVLIVIVFYSPIILGLDAVGAAMHDLGMCPWE